MASAGALRRADRSSTPSDGTVTAQSTVTVSNCSRLGRTANPPGFSLPDWLRPGRRR
jgi:hypothetical protein